MKNLSKNSDWKKKLSRISKKFYRNNKRKVIDIILYGSAARGKYKPRDIDILILLKEISRKEYFEMPYELRKEIEKEEIKADVKGIKIDEIFDKTFLARQAVFVEGYSLVRNKFLSENLGFKSYSLFFYSLRSLNHIEKTKFQYALNGRRGAHGILKRLKGEHIGIGSILIPIELSERFKEFLESWKIEYREWRGVFVEA